MFRALVGTGARYHPPRRLIENSTSTCRGLPAARLLLSGGPADPDRRPLWVRCRPLWEASPSVRGRDGAAVARRRRGVDLFARDGTLRAGLSAGLLFAGEFSAPISACATPPLVPHGVSRRRVFRRCTAAVAVRSRGKIAAYRMGGAMTPSTAVAFASSEVYWCQHSAPVARGRAGVGGGVLGPKPWSSVPRTWQRPAPRRRPCSIKWR